VAEIARGAAGRVALVPGVEPQEEERGVGRGGAAQQAEAVDGGDVLHPVGLRSISSILRVTAVVRWKEAASEAGRS
jgi:hypothetical protein